MPEPKRRRLTPDIRAFPLCHPAAEGDKLPSPSGTTAQPASIFLPFSGGKHVSFAPTPVLRRRSFSIRPHPGVQHEKPCRKNGIRQRTPAKRETEPGSSSRFGCKAPCFFRGVSAASRAAFPRVVTRGPAVFRSPAYGSFERPCPVRLSPTNSRLRSYSRKDGISGGMNRKRTAFALTPGGHRPFAWKSTFLRCSRCSTYSDLRDYSGI